MSEPNLGVVAHAADDLRIDELPEPDPAPDEAVIAVAYGGICGSDLGYWRYGMAGRSILREPMILGHEMSGTVIVRAADGSGPDVGTRITAHPATATDDGSAPYPKDRPNLAPAVTYLGSAARLPHKQGTFARRIALPTRMLRPLPDSVDLRRAALVEPASVAWHAVARAGGVAGKSALVIGAGPIGLLVVSVLSHHGATRIVATDLERLPLDIARTLGAADVLDARDGDSVARQHAEVVVESSGSVPGLASALAGARRSGRVVLLGLQKSGDIPVPISIAIERELEVTGSFRFNDEIDEVIAALADGTLNVDPVVTHTFDVTDALEAFAVAADASASSKVLLQFTKE